jgi:hypothetical protein
MSVLVLSDDCDPTTDMVVEALGRRGARVDRFDLGWFPARLDLDAELGVDGWSGVLRAGNREVRLREIRAVFYRSPTAFVFPPGLSGPALHHARMEAKLGLGGCLWALPGVVWVNHPAGQADMRKPAQLAAAQAAGLPVPRSLVTNRADAVRRFVADVDGPIVVKPLGYASILEEGVRRAMYTRVLSGDDLADLGGVEVTSHLFQRYIDTKIYELRLTVVDDGDDVQLFSVAIHAGSEVSRVDFRADYDSLSYSVVGVPDEVVVGVRRFMSAFGIRLGHFDFCVDAAGTHWFLECNGSGGQFQFVEKATGLPITDAIADLLSKGAP